jgi:predicted SAM-dependent methyltransferase
MKLNLGSNDRTFPGFIGVDIAPGPGVDQIADLGKKRMRIDSDGSVVTWFDPWPWPDSSVEEVLAYDVFEHLESKRHTMHELWRILKPGGIARIQVPHGTDGDGGVCDLTHVSLWSTSDFEYYHPGIAERERFRHSSYYAVKADFKVVDIKTMRFPRTFGGYVVEIQVVLQAIK